VKEKGFLLDDHYRYSQSPYCDYFRFYINFDILLKEIKQRDGKDENKDRYDQLHSRSLVDTLQWGI
jgi:hypothetical protein